LEPFITAKPVMLFVDVSARCRRRHRGCPGRPSAGDQAAARFLSDLGVWHRRAELGVGSAICPA